MGHYAASNVLGHRKFCSITFNWTKHCFLWDHVAFTNDSQRVTSTELYQLQQSKELRQSGPCLKSSLCLLAAEAMQAESCSKAPLYFQPTQLQTARSCGQSFAAWESLSQAAEEVEGKYNLYTRSNNNNKNKKICLSFLGVWSLEKLYQLGAGVPVPTSFLSA